MPWAAAAAMQLAVSGHLYGEKRMFLWRKILVLGHICCPFVSLSAAHRAKPTVTIHSSSFAAVAYSVSFTKFLYLFQSGKYF